MDKFRNWYITYWTEITWFIIGWLSFAALEALSREQYTSALIDVILIAINYSFARR